MITKKPIKVAFVVADVPAAVIFFTKTLDLELEASYPSGKGEGQDFIFLKSDTIYVELLPEVAMEGAPLGFHHLAFFSDDVGAHLKELKERGADVLQEAYSAGVGGITLGDFRGPEGILLRLFNKPE